MGGSNTNAKKVGVVLILVGFCLPLVLFNFASGYNPRAGILWSIPKMKLTLKTDNLALFREQRPARISEIPPSEERLRYVYPFPKEDSIYIIPYKYPLSIGIILIFAGIGIVALSKPKSGSPTNSK